MMELLSPAGNVDKLRYCYTYGADAAYLDTSRDGERVYFKLSGDIGYTSIDNVTLHPHEELNVSLSVYTIKDGKLFHNIKTQLKEDFFSYTLAYDDAPSSVKLLLAVMLFPPSLLSYKDPLLKGTAVPTS